MKRRIFKEFNQALLEEDILKIKKILIRLNLYDILESNSEAEKILKKFKENQLGVKDILDTIRKWKKLNKKRKLIIDLFEPIVSYYSAYIVFSLIINKADIELCRHIVESLKTKSNLHVYLLKEFLNKIDDEAELVYALKALRKVVDQKYRVRFLSNVLRELKYSYKLRNFNIFFDVYKEDIQKEYVSGFEIDSTLFSYSLELNKKEAEKTLMKLMSLNRLKNQLLKNEKISKTYKKLARKKLLKKKRLI